MLTKSDRVKSALALCHAWYAKMDHNIRTLSERIDAMWHEVDYHVDLMEQAELEDDAETATACLERVIHFLMRIEAEANAART